MEESSGHHYIATQGPLSRTAADFWTMVWQQQANVVIMLCKTCENDIEKCHKYWPQEEEQALTFPDRKLEVKLKSVESFPDFNKRELELTSGENQSRTVFQFQFLSWPDFGVPESTSSILSFLENTRQTRMDCGGLQSPPAVVHCSAGIGRTGTFCLLDSFATLLTQKKIKDNNPTLKDVCDALLKMRKYRAGLVQTHQQLRYSYEAIQVLANDNDNDNDEKEEETCDKDEGSRGKKRESVSETYVDEKKHKTKRQRTDSEDSKSG